MRAVQPGLLDSNLSEKDLSRVELGLAWDELIRRPAYHAARIAGTTLLSIFQMDKAVTSWSLSSPGVMPRELRRNALALRNTLQPLLVIYPLLLQVLFAASVLFAFSHRPLLRLILPILIPILLKIGLHIVVVSQARYFLVVAALEMLAIAVVSEWCFEARQRGLLLRSLLLGALTVLLLLGMALLAQTYVMQHMEPPQTGFQPMTHTAYDHVPDASAPAATCLQG
jgi:hypothetical protein